MQGGISATHSSPLLHPSSHEGPKSKDWGGQGCLLLHILLLCGAARGLLLTLCRGHSTESSCSSQQMHGSAGGSMRGHRCGDVLQSSREGCREAAAKANKVPPARKHPRGTTCSPVVSEAVPGAPGYREIVGNGTTLVLAEAGEREPRQEGSPTSQAQHPERLL